jgi:hypothetical protein
MTNAVAQAVQRAADKGVTVRLRALEPAQRQMGPERNRGQERADDNAADQVFPEHIGVEGADIA